MYYYIKLNLKKIQIRGKANKFLGRLNSALKVFAEKTESKGEIIGFQVNSEKEL